MQLVVRPRQTSRAAPSNYMYLFLDNFNFYLTEVNLKNKDDFAVF
jgi:hypothetical protein